MGFVFAPARHWPGRQLLGPHRPGDPKAGEVRSVRGDGVPTAGAPHGWPVIGVAVAPHRASDIWVDDQFAVLVLKHLPRPRLPVLAGTVTVLAPTPHAAVGVEQPEVVRLQAADGPDFAFTVRHVPAILFQQ